MWDLAVYAFFFAWSTAALVLLGGWCLGALRSRAPTDPVAPARAAPRRVHS